MSRWLFASCLAASLLAGSADLTAQERAATQSDVLKQLQTDAVAENFSPIAHWGSNPARYSQWTSHSNRLVPVYTFGTSSIKGGSLADYVGDRSVYRRESDLARVYGFAPANSVDPKAEFMDQTNIHDMQKAALVAGKKRIILLVFDGMGWEASRAAAIHASGKPYDSGRGAGLSFQTYSGAGPSEFGLMCTSPHSGDKIRLDVDTQTVGSAEGAGGYDVRRGGSAPWQKPPTPEYPKGPDHSRGAHVVTDSSASATSMCAGAKTYNYGINVLPGGRQLETIAHVAQQAGYRVGAVTSVPISHATPAAAYAHNVSRRDYQDLTRDMVGLASASHSKKALPGMDVVLGAGWGVSDQSEKAIAAERKNQGSNHRPGNRYLTAEDRRAVDVTNGGRYVVAERTPGRAGAMVLKEAVEKAKSSGRLLGFFGVAGLGEGHLPFATADGGYDPAPDREGRVEKYSKADLEENPTLTDLTNAALEVLGQGDGKFWLMVEAGDVDWAMHANNLDSMIGAVYSGDNAFRAIVAWVEKNGGWDSTALIVTADHDHYLVLERPQALAPSPVASGGAPRP